MSVLIITGPYLFSSLASASEVALFQTGISGQLATANGNLTALKTQIVHGIAAGPAYRGTFDIAWSCLLTILACIYNAIHLNVPRHNTATWKLLLRKVIWASVALFAPELVVYTAMKEFLDAYKVEREVNSARGQIRGTSKPTLVDLRYGFYVTMGGFVYDVENLYDDLCLVNLTPRGVISLARKGRFVDISTEDIIDKSKAGIFTKGLICIQVLWMVIQCIARKAVGYPLTLLEVHTMVHVVCALLLYVFWWKKPYDIIEPTVIYPASYASYADTVALMIMASKITRFGNREVDYTYFDVRASLENNVNGLVLSGRETSVANNDMPTTQASDGPVSGISSGSELRSEHNREAISSKSTVCTLQSKQSLPCGIGIPIWVSSRNLTSTDIRRWELGASAIKDILKATPTRDNNLADLVEVGDLAEFTVQHEFNMAFVDYIGDFPERMTRTLPEDWDKQALLKSTGVFFLSLLRFFIPLTTAYGGIHLSAWNFDFPSRIESIIWRTSCFVIMGSFFPFLVAPIEKKLDLSKPGRAFKIARILVSTVFDSSAWLLFFCYAAARLYLVVESLISLRQVPIGVYAAIPWVQNIPHI